MLTLIVAVILCVLTWPSAGAAALLWIFPGSLLIDIALGVIGLGAFVAKGVYQGSPTAPEATKQTPNENAVERVSVKEEPESPLKPTVYCPECGHVVRDDDRFMVHKDVYAKLVSTAEGVDFLKFAANMYKCPNCQEEVQGTTIRNDDDELGGEEEVQDDTEDRREENVRALESLRQWTPVLCPHCGLEVKQPILWCPECHAVGESCRQPRRHDSKIRRECPKCYGAVQRQGGP